jgi:hypothetical protein
MSAHFTYLHSSGRFDRSPELVAEDLAAWLHDGEVSLLTFTEFKRRDRLHVIEELPGWALFNGVEDPGGDDCVVAWREDTWALRHSESAVVSTKRSYTHDGKLIPPQHVTTVLLYHRRSGRTLLVSASHLPSHVEVPGGLRSSLRSAVWRDATKTWQRVVRDYRRAWRPTARVLVADWNVSIRARWFRVYLGNLFPAMRPVWRSPFPRRGTLGGRIIDVALVSRRLGIASARVLGRHGSSDHRAFRVELSFR